MNNSLTSTLHMQQTSDITDEAVLAKLGYKQELRRVFTPLEVFGVPFSNIALAPSIAAVLVYALPNGGAVALVWGWVVACAFIVCIALALAELASAAPTSGGLYYWTYSLASPRCRNFLAWIVGYANTIGNIAAVASVDWALAVQITAAISIASDQTYVITNEKLFGIYVAVLLSHGVLVSLGSKLMARLQKLYISMNLALCFIIIIGLPIATPSEYKNSASFALGDFTNLNGWPSGFAFILSFLTPLFTIAGYDSAVHMSEETINAAVVIPWVIISSNVVSAIIGIGMVLSIAFCMGNDIVAIMSSPLQQPMAQILYNSFGQKGALAIWCLIIITLYMTGSNVLMVSSRQAFAFSRDGALPFSRYLYRINRYTNSPVNIVWFVVVLSLLLGILSLASTQTVEAVFTISLTAVYVSYITPITTRFVFENNFKPGPFNLGKLSFPIAVVAVTFMVFMNVVFFFPTTPQTNAQEMNYTVVVLGGFMLLVVLGYYYPVYGGVHWFNGPVSNTSPIKGELTEKHPDLEQERSDAELSVSSKYA